MKTQKEYPTRTPTWIRSTATCLLMAFCLHASLPVSAALISSQTVGIENGRDADLSTVRKSLETKIVQDRLEQLGFTGEEIATRLSYATDEDLHMLAVKSEEAQAGGSAVVEVLLIILLVYLILEIAD